MTGIESSDLPSPDGDIQSSQTYGALARTLDVALGVPASALEPDFNSNAGGKVINTALNGISG